MPGITETKSCMVHQGDWDSKTDENEAMKFMHYYTQQYDDPNTNKDDLFNNHVTKDFQYVKADGTVFPPGKESWDAVVGTYAPLKEYHHEPYFFTCWETREGWDMTGNAWLYANVAGGTDADQTLTSNNGKKWEVKVCMPLLIEPEIYR